MPELDMIRAVAVILVILLHTQWVGCGWIGVQAFFVLSGYLITGILIRSHTKTTGLLPYLKTFYGRRFLRIMPLYWLYIAILVALGTVSANLWDPLLLLSLCTFTYNLTPLVSDLPAFGLYSHLWSLCVEEQFYLLWPFAVYSIPITTLRRVCVFLMLSGPLVRWLTASFAFYVQPDVEIASRAIYWFPFTHLDAFATGAWIAITPLSLEGAQRRVALWVAFGAALVAGQINDAIYRAHGKLYSVLTLGYPLHGFENYDYIWMYSAINLLSGVIIIYITSRELRNGHSLPVSALQRLGQISYGVYVLHYPLVVGAYLLVPQSASLLMRAGHLGAVLVTTICISGLSFRFFELPILRLKDKFFPRPE